MGAIHWGDDIALTDIEEYIVGKLDNDSVLRAQFNAGQIAFYFNLVRLFINTISREKLPLYRASCGRVMDTANGTNSETSLLFTLYRGENTGLSYRFEVKYYEDSDVVVGTCKTEHETCYYDYNRDSTEHYQGVKLPFLLSKLLLEQV